MYNLIEYRDNYSKAFGTLWQYCRDELVLDGHTIIDFNADNVTTASFKIKDRALIFFIITTFSISFVYPK